MPVENRCLVWLANFNIITGLDFADITKTEPAVLLYHKNNGAFKISP
jgi:hypothetical protein